MKLKDFLSSRPKDEPLKLLELSWSKDTELCCVLESEDDKSFRVTFSGVVEAELSLGKKNASFMRFEISEEDPLLWDYGPHSSIFGNAPLPDPPRFFFHYYPKIRYEAGLNRDPAKYLNWQESFRDWRTHVYQRAYNLLSAPNQVVKLSTSLLDEQAAEYTVLSDASTEQSQKLFAARLGNSWVICKDAEVNLEP